MYNQYLSAQPFAAEPLFEPPCADEPPGSADGCPCGEAKKTPAGAGGLLQGLAGRLGEIKFDADTLIAIAVIWFLLSDGDALDTDLLVIIGVLLLLGI